MGKSYQNMHVLIIKINRNITEMIYTTIYNKNINGKHDPRATNFSKNYTKITLKAPQFSQILSATYYLKCFSDL